MLLKGVTHEGGGGGMVHLCVMPGHKAIHRGGGGVRWGQKVSKMASCNL